MQGNFKVTSKIFVCNYNLISNINNIKIFQFLNDMFINYVE